MNKTEKVILVNEADQPIGEAEKISAHENAQCHRAFSVFILKKINNTINVLIHQRNPNKYHCGGLWTNTCCGHPRPKEESQAGAERRLMEEMGIASKLHPAGKFHYIATFENGLTENEIDHVFYNFIEHDNFTVNPEEVNDFKWLTISSLKEQLNANPEQFTPWLEQALSLLLKQALGTNT